MIWILMRYIRINCFRFTSANASFKFYSISKLICKTTIAVEAVIPITVVAVVSGNITYHFLSNGNDYLYYWYTGLD